MQNTPTQTRRDHAMAALLPPHGFWARYGAKILAGIAFCAALLLTLFFNEAIAAIQNLAFEKPVAFPTDI